MTEPDLIVYHDGSCPLCRLEIAHYRRQRGAERIRFVDVADAAADPGPGLDRRQAMALFHVRLPNGDVKSGADAFIEIWRLLPRWHGAARIAGLPGMRTALGMGYRAFAPVRPKLARIVGGLGLA